MSARRGVWAGLVLLGFGLFMAGQAVRLGLGTLRAPGPGFFPCVMALGLAAASLVAMRSRPAGVPAALGRPLLITAGVAAFAPLLEVGGFPLASVGLLLFLWVVIDRQPPARGLLRAAIVAAAAYSLFDRLLRVQFPRGLLPF